MASTQLSTASLKPLSKKCRIPFLAQAGKTQRNPAGHTLLDTWIRRSESNTCWGWLESHQFAHQPFKFSTWDAHQATKLICCSKSHSVALYNTMSFQKSTDFFPIPEQIYTLHNHDNVTSNHFWVTSPSFFTLPLSFVDLRDRHRQVSHSCWR